MPTEGGEKWQPMPSSRRALNAPVDIFVVGAILAARELYGRSVETGAMDTA
jgi:hypothetical protein